MTRIRTLLGTVALTFVFGVGAVTAQTPAPAPTTAAKTAPKKGEFKLKTATTAAGKEWDSLFGDGQDAHVQYVHGASFRAFSSDSRFDELARRLWDPLLAAES